MLLFFLSNLVFLACFVWLMLSGVGIMVWAGWVVAWFVADYAVIWLTGYQPPNRVWGAILAVMAAIWALLASGIAGA